MLRGIIDGVFAGILVSIGGTALLSCESSVIGAVLFSIALLVICYRGYSLYTGKIGYMVLSHTKQDLFALLTGLLGNLIGTALCGFAVGYALPDRAAKAATMWGNKMLIAYPAVFVRAIFCGILMYLAVAIWKDKKSTLAIFFCVPVFILSGFEHSIADLFYFFAAGEWSGKGILFLLIVLLGNTVGGMLFPLLGKLSGRYRSEG